MSDLFEKHTHGDKRTLAREFKKGEKIVFSDKTTIIFKKRVKVRVTQRWDYLAQDWEDDSIDYANAVDAEASSDLPIAEVGLPQARVNASWWSRFTAWFQTEESP